MPAYARAGSTTAATSAGPQVVNGLGFQPKALIYSAAAAPGTYTTPATDLDVCYGFSDGTTTLSVLLRDVDAMATTTTARAWASGLGRVDSSGTVILSGTISFNPDGFTITWDVAPPSGYTIAWLALGGSVSAKVKQCTKNGTGADAQTGAGFTPTALVAISASMSADAPTTVNGDIIASFGTDGLNDGAGSDVAVGMWSDDNNTTSQTSRQMNNGSILVGRSAAGTLHFQATASSKDVDGHTFTWGANAQANHRYGVLWLAGLTGRIRIFTGDASSGSHSQSFTGLAARPDAGIIFNAGLTASSTADNANMQIGLGFWDAALNQASVGWYAGDNNADSDTFQSVVSDAAIDRIYSSTGIRNEGGEITAIGATSFDVLWNSEKTTTQIQHLVMYFTGLEAPVATRRPSGDSRDRRRLGR